MRTVCILGSTGSIGTQTLEVIRRHPDMFSVVGLTCGKNIKLLKEQIREFDPSMVAVADEKDIAELKSEFPYIEYFHGLDGITNLARFTSADVILNALVGSIGIKPTYEAVKLRKAVALANKETLVAGGSLIMKTVSMAHAFMIPVDSEHSAIFQALQGNKDCIVNKIILTASGGPFRGYSLDMLKNVTKEQALHHPNWNMGAKVTIDSSTMMNKGLEVIEAKWLFGAPVENIEVVVHPESVLHSAIEFQDGCIIGQMGCADMKMPIAYALSYPERLDNIGESLDLFKLSAMHFEKPDLKVFKCLDLAIEAAKKGSSYTACLNAANEVAVKAFLEDKIPYYRIADLNEMALEHHNSTEINSVEDIFEVERQTKEYLEGCL